MTLPSSLNALEGGVVTHFFVLFSFMFEPLIPVQISEFHLLFGRPTFRFPFCVNWSVTCVASHVEGWVNDIRVRLVGGNSRFWGIPVLQVTFWELQRLPEGIPILEPG